MLEVLLGRCIYMVNNINVPHIRRCKSCSCIKEIYASDLCKKCYYRFYMRWWRVKNKKVPITKEDEV